MCACIHVCAHDYVCMCVSVCIWKVFLLRQVAGNLSIALRVSENKIINCFLFFFGGAWIYCTEYYQVELHSTLAIWILCEYAFSIVRVLNFLFYLLVIRGVPMQSDHHTTTGFGSFKLLICGWLQKRWSHSHMYMESS